MISEGLWKRKFASNPHIVGQAITLDGVPRTIIGIVPASFQLEQWNFHPAEAYTPVGEWREPQFRDRAAAWGMDAIARLKPGVTLAEASQDMQRVNHGLGGDLSRRRRRHQDDDRSPERADRWRRAPGAGGADGRRAVRAADRLRQCREPATGAVDGAGAGVCSARRAGSTAGTTDPAGADREPGAGRGWRRAWTDARRIGARRQPLPRSRTCCRARKTSASMAACCCSPC